MWFSWLRFLEVQQLSASRFPALPSTVCPLDPGTLLHGNALPNCVMFTALGFGYFSSDFWYSAINLKYSPTTQPLSAPILTSSRWSRSMLKIDG